MCMTWVLRKNGTPANVTNSWVLLFQLDVKISRKCIQKWNEQQHFIKIPFFLPIPAYSIKYALHLATDHYKRNKIVDSSILSKTRTPCFKQLCCRLISMDIMNINLIVLTEQQEPLIYPIQQIDKIPLNLRQHLLHSYHWAHHYASNPPVIDKYKNKIYNFNSNRPKINSRPNTITTWQCGTAQNRSLLCLTGYIQVGIVFLVFSFITPNITTPNVFAFDTFYGF